MVNQRQGILPCAVEKGRKKCCVLEVKRGDFSAREKKKLLQGSQPAKLRHWGLDQPQLSSAPAPQSSLELAVQWESSRRSILYNRWSDGTLAKNWTQARELQLMSPP
jgi:hypothetical protein